MGAMAEGASAAGEQASSSGGKAPAIQTGWRRLDNWITAITNVIDANHNECVTRAFNSRQSKSDDGSGMGGGAGSGGNGGTGLPDYPTEAGTYVLGVVISGDPEIAPALQWIVTTDCL